MPHTHDLSEVGGSYTTLFPPAQETELPTPPSGCRLNIKTNWPMQSPFEWVIQNPLKGNYSSWIDVNITQSVAVSGMASCASLFVGNHDWSKIAACHMSGQAQFSKGWCEKLLEAGNVKPCFFVFTTSEESTSDKDILAKYKKKLNVKDYLRIKGCGAILVQRIIGGKSVVFAGRNNSDIEIPCSDIEIP